MNYRYSECKLMCDLLNVTKKKELHRKNVQNKTWKKKFCSIYKLDEKSNIILIQNELCL